MAWLVLLKLREVREIREVGTFTKKVLNKRGENKPTDTEKLNMDIAVFFLQNNPKDNLLDRAPSPLAFLYKK